MSEYFFRQTTLKIYLKCTVIKVIFHSKVNTARLKGQIIQAAESNLCIVLINIVVTFEIDRLNGTEVIDWIKQFLKCSLFIASA